MKFIEPKVYLITQTKVDSNELQKLLESVGGSIALDWLSKTKTSSRFPGERKNTMMTRPAGKEVLR